MFGDDAAIASMQELPTDSKRIAMPALGMGASYSRTSLSSTKVEVELNCMMACFSLDFSASADVPSLPSVEVDAAVARPLRDRGYSLI
jgi:hypothetical protein